MTIDELKTRLKQINPDLKLDVGIDNEPMRIRYTVSKYYDHDDLELFRIDENDYYFEPIINEIYEANSLIGSDTVKEVGDLLFKYFEPELSKESQKISNDSKNGKGSIVAFSKPASKYSQKKTKEKLIYEFVDKVIDHGFTVEQSLLNQKTTSIEIGIKDVSENLLLIDMNLLDRAIFPIEINKMGALELNLDRSIKFSWLLNQSNELVKELEQ